MTESVQVASQAVEATVAPSPVETTEGLFQHLANLLHIAQQYKLVHDEVNQDLKKLIDTILGRATA
jgi:hypothetical protein